MKKIPIGYENFKEVIESDCYYVDKTKILEDLLSQGCKAVLFPRPRRFGKSLTMSMLDNFFNIETKENNKDLFNDLYISKSEYFKYMGEYPVINISFKDLKSDTYEGTFNKFKLLISKLYSSKMYLIDSLYDFEKETFNNFLTKAASKEEYEESIRLLCDYLYRYYNKGVIILIDEYDVPIQQGYMHDFYTEIINLISPVLSSCLKGNNNLKMGIMTGVLRVSRESIFSDLNNIEIFSVVDNDYNNYFGFTSDETKKLLEYYNLELNDKVKEKYNGYNFGGLPMYNPWSIINYASRKVLTDYWVNTSSNEIIKSALENSSEEIKPKIEKLIAGDTIEFSYDPRITYMDISNITNMNIIINLFLTSGYLTVADEDFGNRKNLHAIIPNKEIKNVFYDMIVDIINTKHNSATNSFQKFKDAIIKDDIKDMEDILNYLLIGMSYNDRKQYELFYHGFAFGAFSAFLYEDYIVKSNREAGRGRYDVMIQSADNTYGAVLEFKIADTNDNIEQIATNALNQIEEKEYYKELIHNKVSNIHKYSIVFFDGKCIVR